MVIWGRGLIINVIHHSTINVQKSWLTEIWDDKSSNKLVLLHRTWKQGDGKIFLFWTALCISKHLLDDENWKYLLVVDLSWGWLCPQGQSLETFWVVTTWGKDANGIYWVGNKYLPSVINQSNRQTNTNIGDHKTWDLIKFHFTRSCFMENIILRAIWDMGNNTVIVLKLCYTCWLQQPFMFVLCDAVYIVYISDKEMW